MENDDDAYLNALYGFAESVLLSVEFSFGFRYITFALVVSGCSSVG